MRFVILVLAQAFLLISNAQAEIICGGKTELGKTITLKIFAPDSVTVAVASPEGVQEFEEKFTNVDHVWDGHMTGLITARGLSIKYDNHFGVTRNVVLTTYMRGGKTGHIQSVKIPDCLGELR